MTAFASIHTGFPSSQSSHEGVYPGYHRVPVECQIGAPFLRLVFPEVLEDTDKVMTHIAIGSDKEGDGKVFLALSSLPHIPLQLMQEGKSPHIIIMYPESISESTRIVHQMIAMGKLDPEDMAPAFFERVNSDLENAKMPILKVVRQSVATWRGKMSQIPSFLH